MSASKQPLTFVLDLGQPPGQDIKIPVTSDQHSSAVTSPALWIKGAISGKQTGHAGTHSSGGRGGGSEGRGRGGDRSGHNDRSNSNNNNNHRGNRSGGNVRKVSVQETLYNQYSEVIDVTGLSKREIISRMKKGNVGASQLEQFVSDLFLVLDRQLQEGKKTQEESWIQVSKKSVKRTSAQRQQGTGIPGQRGCGAMCDDRGDCGRSAPNRTMARSVRNNNHNHNHNHNHNNHNKRGTPNGGSHSGLDKQG